MNKRTVIGLHALRAFPPSNPNRDDNNSPKSVRFGGELRRTLSSQSQKAAIKKVFEPTDTTVHNSRRLPEEIAKHLEAMQYSREEALKKAKLVCQMGGFSFDTNNKDILGATIVFTPHLAKRLAEFAHNNKSITKSHKDEILAIFHNDKAAAIKLFGRMSASNPELNVDAAAQVGFAIGLTRGQIQSDFFVARDTLADQGSSMLGVREFDEAVFYQFASVDANELLDYLNGGNAEDSTGDGVETLINFIRSFVVATPSGASTTFGTKLVAPHAVYLTVGEYAQSAQAAFRSIINSSDDVISTAHQRLVDELGSDVLGDLDITALLHRSIADDGIGDVHSKLESFLGAARSLLEEAV